MKNKKGFTLIELLAVIVILGVLIGIAYPSISGRIRETRDKTYSLHEADMKAATMNLMSECVSKGEECVPNGESRTYYLSELIAKKYSKELKDPENTDNFCDEEKSYVVVKNDSDNLSNFEYEVCLVCSNYASERCKEGNNSDRCENIDDNEGPECGETSGGSTIWTNSDRVISIGCKDKGGCGCSQAEYYKRFSETMEKGTIEIKDRKGNKTSCEVNVYVDKNVPECELEVIGTIGENGWYGNAAPKVRFKSKTDKESGIESYGIGTSSKEYNFNREEEYTVERGITTVYGYVRDNAGNVGMCHTNSIKYDDVKPTITNVRYGYQVYPKEDMHTKSSNKIKINDISGEYGTIYGIEVELNNNPYGINLKMKQGNNTIGEVTISAGVTTMKYNITPGVYNNISFEVGEGQSIEAIQRIRLLTGEINQKYYTNKNVKIYVTSHDSYSGKAYYTYDGTTYIDKDTKEYEANDSNIKVGIKDHAGNKSPLQAVNLMNIDKKAPNCNISQSGTNIGVKAKSTDYYWYNSDIGISLDKEDKGGVTRYYDLGTTTFSTSEQYAISSSNKGKYNNLDKGTQSVDTSGQNWYGYVIDKAGNISSCSTVAHKDTIQPTCNINIDGVPGNNGWYKSRVVNISMTRNDDRSGMHQYGLTTSSTADYNSLENYAQGNTDNNGVLWYGYVEDNAGNTVSCQPNTINTDNTKSIKVDATAPTCTATKGQGGGTEGVYVTVKGNDDTSGVSWTGGNSTYNTNGNSEQEWTYTVEDNAGNQGTCKTTIYRTSHCYSSYWYGDLYCPNGGSRSGSTCNIYGCEYTCNNAYGDTMCGTCGSEALSNGVGLCEYTGKSCLYSSYAASRGKAYCHSGGTYYTYS